jgi:hypothetical protein
LGIDAHLDKVNSSSTCGVKSLAPAAEISMRTNGSRSLMLAQHDNFSEFESWLHRSNIYRPVCRSFHFDCPKITNPTLVFADKLCHFCSDATYDRNCKESWVPLFVPEAPGFLRTQSCDESRSRI